MAKAALVATLGVLIAVGSSVVVFRKQIAAAVVQIITPLPPGTTTTPPPPGGSFTPGQGGPAPGSGGSLSATISADKTQGQAPLVVKFSPNISGGTLPIQYRWAFGDGGTSIDANPIYTFSQVGAYTVALSVIDALGQSYTDFISIATNNLPPPPPPGPTNPINQVSTSILSGVAPLTIGFSISVLDPLSSIAWDFGDPYASTFNPNTDSGQVVNHSYFTAGNYTAKVTVVGKYGTQTKTFNVAVSAKPTTGIQTNLFLSETNGPAPLYVAFSMSLNVPNTAIHWDFGDGVVDDHNVLAIGHTYTKSGTFNGSVKITSDSGQTLTKQFSVTVGSNPTTTPTASIVLVPSPDGHIDAQTPFTVEGQAGGGTPGYSYSWDFGDNTGIQNGQLLQHQYIKAGTFVITLTVRDSLGDVATAQKTVTCVTAPIQQGDAQIIIVSNQPVLSGGLQFNSLQLQVKNNRPDTPITGYIAIRIFDNKTSQEIGTEQDSSNVTVPASGKIVIPPITTGGYVPGGKLIEIAFWDPTDLPSKPVYTIDLNY